MEYKRKDRVADVIHHEISGLLIKGIKDPRIGFVTVTGVELSADLQDGIVYYSLVGTDAEKKAAQKGLESATGFIRSELGKTLDLRRIPHLTFRYDSSLEYGDRIEKLLRDIKRESDE